MFSAINKLINKSLIDYKKKEIEQSIKDCLFSFRGISDNDRKILRTNLTITAKGINEDCSTPEQAIIHLANIKQCLIKDHGIRDQLDPAFAQIEIIINLIMAKKLGPEITTQVNLAFNEIFANTYGEKEIFFSNLRRFI